MPEAVAQRLKDLTGLDYIEGYGLSETIAPTHINPPQRAEEAVPGHSDLRHRRARRRSGHAARARPAARSARSSRAGRRSSRATGRSPKPPPRCFIEIDGKRFFRTGDLGRYDEKTATSSSSIGLKRMINASGYKVWPAEVEAMLYGHPDVQEACVIGTQDAASRRDREGGRRAEGGQPRQGRRRGHHRLVRATTWPPTRCRAWSSSSRPCPSPPPARCSGACCRSREQERLISLKPSSTWNRRLPQHLAEAPPAAPDHPDHDAAGTTWRCRQPALSRQGRDDLLRHRAVSYRELQRQAELLAGFLQKRCGVRKGDRVILDMQNSPQFMIAYYAILRADAVVRAGQPDECDRRAGALFRRRRCVHRHRRAGTVRADSSRCSASRLQARHRRDLLATT